MECLYTYIGTSTDPIGFDCTIAEVVSESTTGNIEFGIGIIIVFMSLALIGFVWNSTTRKKPWK